jgi:hypothetical protein
MEIEPVLTDCLTAADVEDAISVGAMMVLRVSAVGRVGWSDGVVRLDGASAMSFEGGCFWMGSGSTAGWVRGSNREESILLTGVDLGSKIPEKTPPMSRPTIATITHAYLGCIHPRPHGHLKERRGVVETNFAASSA